MRAAQLAIDADSFQYIIRDLSKPKKDKRTDEVTYPAVAFYSNTASLIRGVSERLGRAGVANGEIASLERLAESVRKAGEDAIAAISAVEKGPIGIEGVE